jgi:hypothetical protein
VRWKGHQPGWSSSTIGGGLGVIQETLSGKNVDWLEKVSDEQYRK